MLVSALSCAVNSKLNHYRLPWVEVGLRFLNVKKITEYYLHILENEWLFKCRATGNKSDLENINLIYWTLSWASIKILKLMKKM